MRSHIDLQTHFSSLILTQILILILSPLGLKASAYIESAMNYISTDFGVDSQ